MIVVTENVNVVSVIVMIRGFYSSYLDSGDSETLLSYCDNCDRGTYCSYCDSGDSGSLL